MEVDTSSDDDVPLADLVPLASSCKQKLTNTKTDTISEVSESDNELDLSDYDDSDADPTFKPGRCQGRLCKEDIFAACERCNILLCYDHFTEDTDSCYHGRYPQGKKSKKKRTIEKPPFVAVGYQIVTQPETFVVEGAPKEIPTQNIKKTNKQKEAKRKRARGEKYLSPNTNKLVGDRKMGVGCQSASCEKAGRKCSMVAENSRAEIFKSFWELGDLRLQREFIARHVESFQAKRVASNSRRQTTHRYYLTVDNKRTPVCKRMFLSTFGISEKAVRVAIGKMTPEGTMEGERRGGRMSATNKERDKKIGEEINNHISRFPTVESHYCRSTTSKEYLHPSLNLPKMYKMFIEQYVGPDAPSFSTYRNVFKEKNLAFHHPKKDQCSLCVNYREGDQVTKEKLSECFQRHIAEKTKVRELKDLSKEKALSDPSLLAATFDLQQVIYLPISNESTLFYKRRLSNYNLTFYNLGDRHCHCFIWHEGQSKRGSSEIATVVGKALEHYDTMGKKEAQLYADGCPGQNKNSIMPTMLLYFIGKADNLRDISLRFFETSHGQNEGDAVHSTISSALSRAGDVYIPAELTPILKLARVKQPYTVVPMQHDDFWDYKQLSLDWRVLSSRRESDTDDIINWNNIMELRVSKEHPVTIFYKNSHLESSYKTITLKRKFNKFHLCKLNQDSPKVPTAKYNDLLSLCQGSTPLVRLEEHKNFFQSLPH